MADQLKQLPLDEIEELIRRGEQLCDRGRDTQQNELYQFKQDCSLLLGSIGPEVEGLYRRLTELDFTTPSRASRYVHAPGRGILDSDDQVYRILGEMLGILKSAQTRVVALQQERDEQPPQSKSRKTASKTHQYSTRDHAIFDLIGADKFQHMGNDALHRQYRRRAKTELGKDLSRNAFRSILNRIRKRHGFPSSEQVKKSDQS